MLTDPEECLAAAAEIADRFPGPATELRAIAAQLMAPDSIVRRRMILRRIWRTHYPFMARTAAARLIAAEWRAWSEDGGDDLPNTLDDAFARLERAGISRVAHRTLVDDLDVSLK